MYKDIEIGTSIDKNEQSHVKKNQDAETLEFFGNDNYDQEESKTWFLDKKIRSERNHMLEKTDVFQVRDFPLTATELSELDTYRQALRDLPQTIISNDFTDISFPTKPEWLDQKILECFDS
jgi:hypothetical protein